MSSAPPVPGDSSSGPMNDLASKLGELQTEASREPNPCKAYAIINAGMIEMCGRVEGLAYTSVSKFLLTHARSFTPQPRPGTVAKMPYKECFANATRLLMDLRHSEQVWYCEGYATSIIPVLHAWLVREDGTVIDPTWESDTLPVYWGVAWDTDWYLSHIVRTRIFGVLGNADREVADLMRNGVPRNALAARWHP